VKGFDVTGVVTEVDLTFPEINGMVPFPLDNQPKFSEEQSLTSIYLQMLVTASRLAWTEIQLAPRTYTSSVLVTLSYQDIVLALYVCSDSLSDSKNHGVDILNRLSIQPSF
jgi:hypothetical protein